MNAEENQTKAGLIGTISEEGSHIIGKLEGRQIETGTYEKGLESTGRATNEYFKEKYRNDRIELASDGRDYSGVDFGENVGDRCIISEYSCATEVHQTNKNREISTTTSKNYRKKINSFNTLTGKMKSECKSSRKCVEKNGVFVFEKYEDFVYYSEKYKGTGKRDRIRLDYRQNHEKTVVAKENQNNRILQGIEGRYDGKYTKEKGLYTFTDEKAQAQFEKEAREKGATVYTVLSNDKITASSINLNSYKPPYQKQAEQLGTQAFIFAEQNLKIGDGSTKVSDETLALAASSTISDVVRSGLFVIEKTEDKRYEENNPGVQNQVKKLKKEADRLTSESKDRDYYVRVDSKNRTVTIEEDDKPKSYRAHFLNDVLINPLKSASNFGEARNSLLKGDLDRTLQNGLEGIGNFFSLFTLGIGSWAGDHFDRFSPNEVQYGTRQEVERRRATENGLVKETADTITALMLPKKTGNWNIRYEKGEMATIVNASGTLSNARIKVEKVLSLPAMTITGGAKPVIVASNAVKMDSQDSGKDKQHYTTKF